MENDRIEYLLESLLRIELGKILCEAITDEKHKIVYNLTGNKIRTEIEEASGLAGGTISGLWAKWEELGILRKEGKFYKKII